MADMPRCSFKFDLPRQILLKINRLAMKIKFVFLFTISMMISSLAQSATMQSRSHNNEECLVKFPICVTKKGLMYAVATIGALGVTAILYKFFGNKIVLPIDGGLYSHFSSPGGGPPKFQNFQFDTGTEGSSVPLISIDLAMGLALSQDASTECQIHDGSVIIVLDIDECLIINTNHDAYPNLLQFEPELYYGQLDGESNGIFAAYILEFLRYLEDEYSHISFFSNGVEARVQAIAETLWERAFERELDKTVLVLGRNSLTKHGPNPGKDETGDGTQWYGEIKKDLNTVCKNCLKDKKVLLIDNDKSFVTQGQTRQFLKVSSDGYSTLESILYYLKKEDGDLRTAIKNKDFPFSRITGFYKLLLVTGLMETAKNHPEGLIEGLHQLQFRNGKPIYYELEKEFQYYKIGLKKLREYSSDGRFYCQEIEMALLEL